MTGTTFRHYLLTLDGNTHPCLEEHGAPLHPGRPPVADSGQVLLAGGFAAISPDYDLPLSPTLQVNGDLGRLDRHQLTALAVAELQRHNNATWRSTSQEADNRVCVLAADAGELRRFIDTYGGVLAIHPLLVSGCDPDIVTATDLAVTPAAEGLCLDFLVRVPVDRERCTYCGSCGPSCPRDCLSPTLFLDLAACDFCGHCVSACPHDAIDLHAARRQRLETPALLLLDGVDIDTPAGPAAARIFDHERLDLLFASIFPVRIDEVLTCDNRICQHSVRTGRGCDLCLAACHHGAVTISDAGIVIDQQRCVECGACAGVCPTGALQYHRFDDRSFLEYLASLAPGTGTTLVMAGEADLHRFWWRHRDREFAHTLFLEYPRLRALHLMHLLAAVAQGFGRVLLLGDDHPSLQAQVSRANRICSRLDLPDDPVRCVTADELAALLDREAPAAPALLADIDRTDRNHTLAALLERFGAAAAGPLRLDGDEFPEFGMLHCDQNRCTLCLACLNDCRIGALRADRERLLLQHVPLLCVQCGACSVSCPEGALRPEPGLEIGPDQPRTTDLALAEPMLCRQCGRMFGTRQSHERVLRLLREKDLLGDEELYDYCETCRVIRIYGETAHE